LDSHVNVVHKLVGIRMVVRPGESIGTSQFDTIRELEPTEFDVFMKATEYLRQFASRQSVHLMVERNYVALRQILEEAVQEFTATQKVPEHLVANGGFEVNRHLMNFLSSFLSFLDHSETHLDHEDASGTWKQRFKGCRHAFFDTVFAYRFLYGLRNYVQHCGLPLGGIHASAWRDQQGNVQTEFQVYLARDGLLQWPKWRSDVRTSLKEQPKEIKIMPLVEELMGCIRCLNKINLTWEMEHGLREAVQRLGPAMEEILTVRMDVAPALVSEPDQFTDPMDVQVCLFPMPELREAFALIAGDAGQALQS